MIGVPHAHETFAAALAEARKTFIDLQELRSQLEAHRKEHGC